MYLSLEWNIVEPGYNDIGLYDVVIPGFDYILNL